ncbi:hypothetical protein HERIO_1211 [Hepatospora eriocheir]|uniref:Uncharacterized protein n=1 Tax=Hepatospora eriocheir TaxID=1081669 RepID=A0A1X0QAQ5_9MICR|nr:hypothetical protein HERIO_1211 [Hepatospora eriocheir]
MNTFILLNCIKLDIVFSTDQSVLDYQKLPENEVEEYFDDTDLNISADLNLFDSQIESFENEISDINILETEILLIPSNQITELQETFISLHAKNLLKKSYLMIILLS